jgi:KUP system potassium uptake protein
VNRQATARASLALGALGVVFGDIGTSPLYTIQTVFNPSDPHPVETTNEAIFGVVSLIFWSVTLIVTVTYVLLVMRADNDGEGGILALITLIRRRGVPGGRRTKLALAGLGIFGASLFFGDSIITPAISVLSAVEGVEIAAPSLSNLVEPITVAIIVCLFLVQRFGTGTVGRLFGPVMAVWFVSIGAFGIRGIAGHPSILEALSPTYALGFLFGHFAIAFFALTGIVLAVTGAEALYADMGHFGRSPISRVWLLLVFPACALNYLGQGGLILEHPTTAIDNPFFLLVPGWARVAMVFLAAAATVIASQAVIAGAFSVTQQAARLGYLPRLRIAHTSAKTIGQIYVPWVNWSLMLAVLTLVVAFKTSTALAYAYGLAVTGTITITTLLFFYLVRRRWHRPLWIVVLGGGSLVVLDLLFLAANLTKFTHGGWLPLLIALAAFTVLTTWQRGRELVTRKREQEEGPLREFVEELRERRPPVQRVPGTAVFLNRGRTTPLAMRANVEHNHILHEHVLILTIETAPRPYVPVEKRLKIDDLGHRDDGIFRATAHFGYMDTPDVPALLPLLRDADIETRLDEDDLTYFLSKIELHQGNAHGMRRWRKQLFLATSHLTADATEYFHLPRERTVIIGSRIEL